MVHNTPTISENVPSLEDAWPRMSEGSSREEFRGVSWPMGASPGSGPMSWGGMAYDAARSPPLQ